jgi:hypothetical protein
MATLPKATKGSSKPEIFRVRMRQIETFLHFKLLLRFPYDITSQEIRRN